MKINGFQGQGMGPSLAGRGEIRYLGVKTLN